MNDLTLKKDNTNRIRTLQGARFLFVAFIYLSHCVTPNVSTPFDFGGDIGVSFFFILSGFVMSWGYGASSPHAATFGITFGVYIHFMSCSLR